MKKTTTIALAALTALTGCLGSDDAPSFDDPGGVAAPNDPPNAVSEHDPRFPSCHTQPRGSVIATIDALWRDDVAAYVFIEDAYVTAVSDGGCRRNATCEMFLQQHAGYADHHDAAKQGMHVMIEGDVAHRFDNIGPGDRVDVAGQSDYRDGALRLDIGSAAPGCAAVVGEADPEPVDVTIGELDDMQGPALVRIGSLGAEAHANDEAFDAVSMIGDDDDLAVEVSPRFLPLRAFDIATGERVFFDHIVGVFEGGTIYPRTAADLQVALQPL